MQYRLLIVCLSSFVFLTDTYIAGKYSNYDLLSSSLVSDNSLDGLLPGITLEDFIHFHFFPKVPTLIMQAIFLVEAKNVDYVAFLSEEAKQELFLPYFDEYVTKHHLNIDTLSVHDALGMMAKFLFLLKEPIIPFDKREAFYVAAKANDTYGLKELLIDLPPARRDTAAVIMEHIRYMIGGYVTGSESESRVLQFYGDLLVSHRLDTTAFVADHMGFIIMRALASLPDEVSSSLLRLTNVQQRTLRRAQPQTLLPSVLV